MPNELLRRALAPLTDAPSRLANNIANSIDDPRYREELNPLVPRTLIRPLSAGLLQGAGDTLSSMTSPISLAATAIGAPWLGRASKLTSLGLRPAMSEQAMIRLGPEFVPQGSQQAYNTFRRALMNKEKQNVSRMSQEGGVGYTKPASDDEVVQFMDRVAKARGR